MKRYFQKLFSGKKSFFHIFWVWGVILCVSIILMMDFKLNSDPGFLRNLLKNSDPDMNSNDFLPTHGLCAELPPLLRITHLFLPATHRVMIRYVDFVFP